MVSVRSKKFHYALVGIAIILINYFISLMLVTVYPESQSSYIALFNTITPFVSGIIAILLGAHTWMDWKANANTEVNVANIVTSSKRVYAAKHFDDGTL